MPAPREEILYDRDRRGLEEGTADQLVFQRKLDFPRTGLEGTLFSTDGAGQQDGDEQRVEIENSKGEESSVAWLTPTANRHLLRPPHPHSPGTLLARDDLDNLRSIEGALALWTVWLKG